MTMNQTFDIFFPEFPAHQLRIGICIPSPLPRTLGNSVVTCLTAAGTTVLNMKGYVVNNVKTSVSSDRFFQKVEQIVSTAWSS